MMQHLYSRPSSLFQRLAESSSSLRCFRPAAAPLFSPPSSSRHFISSSTDYTRAAAIASSAPIIGNNNTLLQIIIANNRRAFSSTSEEEEAEAEFVYHTTRRRMPRTKAEPNPNNISKQPTLVRWNEDDDELLAELYDQRLTWIQIATHFVNRSATSCKERHTRSSSTMIGRGDYVKKWTVKDDAELKALKEDKKHDPPLTWVQIMTHFPGKFRSLFSLKLSRDCR
jgi:hypothetical protein